MTQIGPIQEFQPDNETVSAYIERVDLYFVTNGTPADIKEGTSFAEFHRSKDLWVTSKFGGTRCTVLRNKTMNELEKVLKNHYEPAPLIIAEMFQFHRRNQAVGESITEYVAELRRLLTSCRFDDYFEQALRDRLVCGLRNEGTRKRLLSEADLTLAKALELGQGCEAAEKNAQHFKETEVAVHHGEQQPLSP